MTALASDTATNKTPRFRSAPPGATAASFVLFGALAALFGMIYIGSEWWNLAGGLGFPSDAAWARAVFARNLASGEGLCFNRGAPVAGVAGFSWIALLAVIGFFSGKFLIVTKVLGILCSILTAYLVWHITLNLLGDWRFAFIAGLLVAVSHRLTVQSIGGTEGALGALAVTAAIHWQAVGWDGTNTQRAFASVAAGLAALSRPELLVLLPLLLADRWLISLAHDSTGERLRGGVLRSLPEIGGAFAVVAPYLVFNHHVGGPLWQQPEMALRSAGAWSWAAATLNALWYDNPVVYIAALLGIPVAAVSALRRRSEHPSLLVILIPIAVVLSTTLFRRGAAVDNALLTAAHLTPLLSVLGAAGLFLLHRAVSQMLSRSKARSHRIALAALIAVGSVSAFVFPIFRHPDVWHDYGFQVKKVSDLQGFIGRWAADHLPADASIASREVGAIGFFSQKRMVDLGGTISQEGIEYLSRPGSPDSHLLDYIQKTRPSHLAIRPGDFPDLAMRPDLLTPAVTCVVTDPISGGVTTMALYETPWPPLSVIDARAQVGRR